jgi:hypothetical protein
MQFPQIFMILIIIISLYYSAKNHGQVVENNFTKFAFSMILNILILIWGNFFSVIAWPQLTIIIIMILSVCLRINQDNDFYEIENFYHLLFSVLVFIFLLYHGNFWK